MKVKDLPFKKEIIEIIKEHGIKNLSPTKDINHKKDPDKKDKPQKVTEHEFITSQEYSIHFRYNSYDFSDKEFHTLERIAGLLVQHPKAYLIVKGYTDSNGNYEQNKKLSELRADSVKRYFVDQGINFSRIKVFGMGQKNPIGSNKTQEGRRQNRRVEIEVNFNKT